MAISVKEVERVARLARIKLTEKEKEKLKGDLSRILDYFEKMKEVDAGNADLILSIAGLTNVFRKDENPLSAEADKIKKMIGQAPERQENFVKTKPVFEK